MIEPGQTYWYVNKPSEVDASHLREYLTRGEWVSSSPGSHRAKLESMEVGAKIALKSVSKRIKDLPFFTGENPASVMTIHATGSISALNPELGTIRVNWDTPTTEREWYFGTGIHALWGLKGGNQNWSDALLAFTFDGTPQDLAPYLTDPYWSSRYAPTPRFQLDPLLRGDGQPAAAHTGMNGPTLAAKIVEHARANPNLKYLITDQFPDGSSGPIRDMDPFTVMGTFNRGMTVENRRAVASGIASLLGVTQPLPEDFDGIPVLNNQRSWFISYSKHRLPPTSPRFGACSQRPWPTQMVRHRSGTPSSPMPTTTRYASAA